MHRQGTRLSARLPAPIRRFVAPLEHQGIVARVSKYPYQTMEELTNQLQSEANVSIASRIPPLVVIVDRIQDAFNFGAILRCCDSAGVCGVIVGEHCQAQVTPQIARSSSGAVNHVEIIRTENLVSAAKSVQGLGLQLVAADTDSKQSVCETPLNTPTALLIGSDTHGIDPLLLGLCDQRVSIPGKMSSLNSAVAAGIMLYEIRRQQG